MTVSTELTAALPALLALAEDVTAARTMLDREEHRYVERYVPCPAGCVWERDPAVDDALTMVQTAGTSPCPHSCFYGTVEDEDAPQINPLLDRLEVAAKTLDALATLMGPGAGSTLVHRTSAWGWRSSAVLELPLESLLRILTGPAMHTHLTAAGCAAGCPAHS